MAYGTPVPAEPYEALVQMQHPEIGPVGFIRIHCTDLGLGGDSDQMFQDFIDALTDGIQGTQFVVTSATSTRKSHVTPS